MPKTMILVETIHGEVLAKGSVFVIPKVGEKINLIKPILQEDESFAKTRSYWYTVNAIVHSWNVWSESGIDDALPIHVVVEEA